MYAALSMHTYSEKTKLQGDKHRTTPLPLPSAHMQKRRHFRQIRLNHSGVGEEMHLKEYTRPKLTQP